LDFAYQRIGLTGDGGSTFFLPRLVGLRKAKELVLTSEAVQGEEAVEMGLANEVVPADEFDDRLDELTADIASGPTAALGNTMRLLTESYDRTLESQLAAETETIADAVQSEDYERGYAAFFEKDDPEFVGR
jgi:2-(1,2-epoxy-1,2-dihydrophenyl)acetyl-CoA isomerase